MNILKQPIKIQQKYISSNTQQLRPINHSLINYPFTKTSKIKNKLHLIKKHQQKNKNKISRKACSSLTQSTTQKIFQKISSIKILNYGQKNEMLQENLNSQVNDHTQISEDISTQYKPNQSIYIRKSQFRNFFPTLFFPYTQQAQQINIQNCNIIKSNEVNKYFLNFKIIGIQYKCIKNTLKNAGLTQGQQHPIIIFDMGAINISQKIKQLKQFQKINHFSACWQIGLKHLMWKNLFKMIRKFPADYNFIPKTYIFNYDFERFQIIRQTSQNNKFWIMKPVDAACGRGVKLISKVSKIKKKSNYLVSQYISSPHLINRFKYDLRLYVVVTSYDPLRIYIYEEGMVRFATQKYNFSKKTITQRFMHLTNYSINKHSQNFKKNNLLDEFSSKWSFKQLKQYYQQNQIDYDKIFLGIDDIIIKTIIAHQDQMLDIYSKSVLHRNNSFQLYGFDILLDQHLKPWLLQVNVCPSLASSSRYDTILKHRLMADMMNLIGIKLICKKSRGKNIKRNNIYMGKNIMDLQQLRYENCLDKVGEQGWNTIIETDQQFKRCKNFRRIFPIRNDEKYDKFFQTNRYNNLLVKKWLNSQINFLSKFLLKFQ